MVATVQGATFVLRPDRAANVRTCNSAAAGSVRRILVRRPSIRVPRNGTAGRVRQATARAGRCRSVHCLRSALLLLRACRLRRGRARGVLPERTCYRNGAVPASRDRARNCSVSRPGAGSILGWPAPLEDFQACRWDGLTGVARMARPALGPCWRWVANRKHGRHTRRAAAFVSSLAARGVVGSASCWRKRCRQRSCAGWATVACMRVNVCARCAP
jgi:hypothetical protein